MRHTHANRTIKQRMTKPFMITTTLLALAVAAIGLSAAPAFAQEEPELEIMTTPAGVEFVRTPDSYFQNLPDWPYEAKYVEIDGLRQAYVDEGPKDGEVILLIHGQPAWSYLYRHMIPIFLEEGYRVIAMDHVGMGRSDKPIDMEYYSYVGHIQRMEAFIEELELEGITVFVQDWGSLIGLNVIGNNPEWFDRVVLGNGNLPTTETMSFPKQEHMSPDEQIALVTFGASLICK